MATPTSCCVSRLKDDRDNWFSYEYETIGINTIRYLLSITTSILRLKKKEKNIETADSTVRLTALPDGSKSIHYQFSDYVRILEVAEFFRVSHYFRLDVNTGALYDNPRIHHGHVIQLFHISHSPKYYFEPVTCHFRPDIFRYSVNGIQHRAMNRFVQIFVLFLYLFKIKIKSFKSISFKKKKKKETSIRIASNFNKSFKVYRKNKISIIDRETLFIFYSLFFYILILSSRTISYLVYLCYELGDTGSSVPFFWTAMR